MLNTPLANTETSRVRRYGDARCIHSRQRITLISMSMRSHTCTCGLLVNVYLLRSVNLGTWRSSHSFYRRTTIQRTTAVVRRFGANGDNVSRSTVNCLRSICFSVYLYGALRILTGTMEFRTIIFFSYLCWIDLRLLPHLGIIEVNCCILYETTAWTEASQMNVTW